MAYDVPLFGNPLGTKSTSKPKRKRSTMAKKGKKKGKSRNPLGISLSGAQGKLMHGAALGLGAVVARAAANNLPLPASLQGGVGEAIAAGVVSFGAGYLAKKIKFTAPYADAVRDGGLALAFYKLVAPKALPLLAFTTQAKNKAIIDAQAYALLAASKAQQTANDQAVSQAGGSVQGIGDAFVMSRGGITTADRAPRDTAALAGMGDAYATERPGFSGGAPNRLKAPWSRSIYTRSNN